MMKRLITILCGICLMLTSMQAREPFEMQYGAEMFANVSKDSNFAPYHISSLNYGTLTQSKGVQFRLHLGHEMDTTKRFSYGFGADVIGGYTNDTKYMQYRLDATGAGSWVENPLHPARVRIQQLFAEVKWRSLFLTVGMKERPSVFLNEKLSSGDLTQSSNSRPKPEVRVGFIHFQNFPGTRGWLQIAGEYGLGKYMDGKWMESQYNYYNKNICTGIYHNYKNIYFRSKPSKPFMATIGIQCSMQFGGTLRYYKEGVVTKEVKEPITWKTFLHTIIPGAGSTGGNDVYVDGNTYGSIDLQFRYRFRNNDELKFYVQNPWEDGSGFGKLNGFDGLWGLEYQRPKGGYVSGAVVEYFDFRNQSGPIHWSLGDYHGKADKEDIPGKATGADNYYNNFEYQGVQYYGLAMGSPLFQSPIYNLDGYQRFNDNRIQGFHLGVMGTLAKGLDYRVLFTYRMSLGTPFIPRSERVRATSVMIEATYNFANVPGLKAKCQLALDRGKLVRDNFGAMLSVSYSGKFSF